MPLFLNQFCNGLKWFLVFLTIGFGWDLPVFADYDHDMQNWSTVYYKANTQRWKMFGEVQNRTGFGYRPNEGEQYLFLRGALSYRLTKRLSLGQGYAWVPGFQPRFFNENRLFQQLEYVREFGKLELNNRTRLEERMIKNVDGTALRLRNKLETIYPLGKSGKWSAVASDEIFFNLNTPEIGNINFEEARPKRGLDQNRLFIGLNRKLNKSMDLEGGYMLRYNNLHGSGVHDLVNHIVVVTLTYTKQ